MAVASQVDLKQGYARAILAREVHIERGGAQSIVAGTVTLGKQSGTFILLARKVEGDVRTVLDWRGALAFGAVLGVAVALLSRRKRG